MHWIIVLMLLQGNGTAMPVIDDEVAPFATEVDCKAGLEAAINNANAELQLHQINAAAADGTCISAEQLKAQ